MEHKKVVAPGYSTMDAKLKEAATLGNVSYLKEALNSKPINYFLLSTENGYNIFHIAVRFQREAFINEAIQTLPEENLRFLLSQQENSLHWNPLHFAAFQGNQGPIQFTRILFKNLMDDLNPACPFPWLMRDKDGNTPFHLALKNKFGDCANLILQIDEKSLCNIPDKEGNSPLFLAVRQGIPEVALQIVKSDDCIRVVGQDGLNPLHILAEKSVETEEDEKWLEIEKLLIKKHPKLLELPGENKNHVLHVWAKANKTRLLPVVVYDHKIKVLRTLSMSRNSEGETPLHFAVEHGNEEFALSLVKRCGQNNPLWNEKNFNAITPLDIALSKRLEKFVLHCISIDRHTYKTTNSEGQSLLYVALKKGMDEVVRSICAHVHEDPSLARTIPINDDHDQQTVLHAIVGCTEETGKLLVQQFQHLIKQPDKNGRRPLDIASAACEIWLIEVLLKTEPTAIESSPKAWIIPCKRSDLEALKLFTRHPDLFKEVCIRNKDSPLHHVKLESKDEYEKLFAISPIWEMKNNCDNNHKTPLHLALERQDVLLAEVLLKQGVDCSISDHDGTTAKSLLAGLCTQHYEWHELCKKMNINPWLKTRYIQDTSTLGKVRDTLAVVAALLATLTFAAGFTLPGGLNQDNGEVLLAKKTSFIMFILADTYAMCCSMFVLFCLIWSMVCDEIQSHILIDRSVLALVHSFCATLVAFMTGIYTVLSEKALWAAILIIVMTTLVGVISCNKTFLYKVVSELIPFLSKKGKKKLQFLKQVVKVTGSNRLSSKKEASQRDNSERSDPLSNA